MPWRGMPAMNNPAQPIRKNSTRTREFPFSTVGSVLVHLRFFGLIVGSLYVSRNRNDAIEWESVTFADPPGAGNAGSDATLKQGIPQGKDVTETLVQKPVRRPDDEDPPQPVVKVDVPPPALPDEP